MFKQERHDQILKILDEKEYISASDLCTMLQVSMPTVRRDLGELASKKLIQRSHGGAKRKNVPESQAIFNETVPANIDVMKQICRYASLLIRTGSTVFIDSSDITSYLAEYLTDKDLKVITNGIKLSAKLSSMGVKVYCTGGEISDETLSLTGSFAEEFLRTFNIDLCIFSCDGVEKDGLINEKSMSLCMLKRIAVKRSKNTLLLCDSSKFDKSAEYNIMSLDDVDAVVTNSNDINLYFNYNYKTKVIKV